MKLKDRVRADREILRSLGREERLLFIWDYYKIPILAAVSAIVLLVMVLVSWAGKKGVAMYAVFVNSDASAVQTQPELLNEMLSISGVDMEGKTIDITADLTLGKDYSNETDGATIQILASLFGISGLDVFAAEMETFDRYAVQDAFVDLSLFLEPELYEKKGCEPYWYLNGDGHKIMGGVVLKPGSAVHTAGFYHADVVIGVAANAQNLEEAVSFVKQLLAQVD